MPVRLFSEPPHLALLLRDSSFEVITYRVFKDKNNVYFLAYDLVQEGGNQGERTSSCEILRGADAATFTKISDMTFVDKDREWKIGK